MNENRSIINFIRKPNTKLFMYLIDNKALLCYNLCQSLLAFQFMSDLCLFPALYTKLPDFYDDLFLLSCPVPATYVCGWVSIDYLWSIANNTACTMRGRGGRSGPYRWKNVLRGYGGKIVLARNLLRQAEAWSHVPVRFLVLGWLGRRSLQIIWEYNLAATVVIHPLNQPRTC